MSVLVLERVGVLLPTRMRFSVALYGKLAHGSGSGRKQKEGGGALSNLYPEPMHGFGRLAGFFQST
jgi:hypothetical protein